jgi:hypothetical protein
VLRNNLAWGHAWRLQVLDIAGVLRGVARTLWVNRIPSAVCRVHAPGTRIRMVVGPGTRAAGRMFRRAPRQARGGLLRAMNAAHWITASTRSDGATPRYLARRCACTSPRHVKGLRSRGRPEKGGPEVSRRSSNGCDRLTARQPTEASGREAWGGRWRTTPSSPLMDG